MTRKAFIIGSRGPGFPDAIRWCAFGTWLCGRTAFRRRCDAQGGLFARVEWLEGILHRPSTSGAVGNAEPR